MILPNGKTINILDMQKMMPGAFGAPPPPPPPHQ
jgi:hypothetical protein